jgi:serine/threonine protein kinase
MEQKLDPNMFQQDKEEEGRRRSFVMTSSGKKTRHDDVTRCQILTEHRVRDADLLVDRKTSSTLPQQQRISLPTISMSTTTDSVSKSALPNNNYSTDIMIMSEEETDTQDSPATSALAPLHIETNVTKIQTSSAALPPSASSPPAPVTPRKFPKLTLSAFRRPEQTVRLTESNPNRRLESEYNLQSSHCRVLGHGAFSTVRLAIRLDDGTRVAVKSIAKHDALRARRLLPPGSRHLDEWEILKLMDHNPHIIDLLDIFETEEEIHLVTEYCAGGELFDAIKKKGSRRSSFRRGRYSEPVASRIANQVLRALEDLHNHNIVHRDVKPENILLMNDDESDIQAKLCDFGMARAHRKSSSLSDGGLSDGESSPSTPGLVYTTNSAPEVVNGSAGPATDIYSLGVTLYILLCGFPPVFCDDTVVFPKAFWADISEEAKGIIRKMLLPDPSKRISATAALTDPWIRQQTTRVRRGSISANLELVRSRLSKAHKRRGSFCGVSVSPKKSRRMSGMTSSNLSFAISDLYAASPDKHTGALGPARSPSNDLAAASANNLNVACG